MAEGFGLGTLIVDFDGAQRTVFHARAAAITGNFIHDRGYASDNVENSGGASINADAASGAFLDIDGGLSHAVPFILKHLRKK